MLDYDDGRQARRSGSLFPEAVILIVAVAFIYAMHKGIITVYQILHLVGAR